MQSLADITHLIIDMDGVLYLGDQPMPCLREFFAFLREHSIRFILATNNSTRTPQEYADKLARMGVTVSQSEILVSGQATARFLAREYPPGTRVHVFGMQALKQAMTDEGFVLADEDVQLVVASMDREVTFEKIKRASLLIRGGARFIATNLDPTNPSEEGLLPGTGTMIVALETASGVKAIAIGKPEPIMYRLAMEQMSAQPETTAAIGDRADTDILGGKRAGLTTICVLSGSSDRAEAEAFEADMIFEDIAHLLDAWKQF
ncbi:MAG TPA: HAD-IIA family hydrolase [Anaerolineales bacterium]|nr:HAD-IIA family hydrolase [Anaerolineales bacterium]